MNPEIWGPHGWYFIQSALVHMPDDADPTHYVNFLFLLQHVLPCDLCRQNYADWVRANPIPTTKNEMIQWVTDLQNSIRVSKGRSQRSVESVVTFYTQPQTNIHLIIIALVVLGIFAARMK